MWYLPKIKQKRTLSLSSMYDDEEEENLKWIQIQTLFYPLLTLSKKLCIVFLYILFVQKISKMNTIFGQCIFYIYKYFFFTYTIFYLKNFSFKRKTLCTFFLYYYTYTLTEKHLLSMYLWKFLFLSLIIFFLFYIYFLFLLLFLFIAAFFSFLSLWMHLKINFQRQLIKIGV